MMENEFIGYTDRTYQQNVANIPVNINAKTPEITDHTDSNPFIMLLKVWYGLIEHFSLYLDNAARESFIPKLRLFSSAVKFARAYDYRVKGAVAASVDITFYTNIPTTAQITIAVGTKVQSLTGIVFETTAQGIIAINDSQVTVPAKQQETIALYVFGNSPGTANQEYVLPQDQIADGSVQVLVNNVVWPSQETLAWSNETDEHCVVSVNEDRKGYIRFGDDNNGKIPPASQEIKMNAKKTQGAAGNLGSEVITDIVSSITVPSGVVIKCKNLLGSSGGADIESLTAIKKNIPLLIRTRERAVTRQDYIDVTELAIGVARAGVIYKCGKWVDVYISPDGGGIASSGLIADTQDWLEERKMITTKVVVHASGEVHITLNADVTLNPGQSKTDRETEIKANIAAFASAANQEVGGTLHESDLYEIIENTVGVKNSQLKKMVSVPYAMPRDASPVLVWARETLAASSSTIHWRVIMTAPTTFQIIRNGSYVGSFSTGATVTFVEIEFAITANSYISGNSWDFVTYKSFGTLILDEPSLPVIEVGDITLNMIGGV